MEKNETVGDNVDSIAEDKGVDSADIDIGNFNCMGISKLFMEVSFLRGVGIVDNEKNKW